MQVLEYNSITCFDCDDTLLLWQDHRVAAPTKVEFKYGGETIYLTPHSFHPLFVKHSFERGDLVIIWSQNGWKHAKKTVETLNLQDHVHFVMGKPTRHVDDKENLADIVGNRIFVPHKE